MADFQEQGGQDIARRAKKKQKNNQGKEVSYTELLTVLCLEYKVCSLEYFLDRMKPYELGIILNNLNLSVKNDWEVARQIMYVTAQTQSTKRLKPQDIMKLPWDNKQQSPSTNHVEITKELRDKMIAEMNANKQTLIDNKII